MAWCLLSEQCRRAYIDVVVTPELQDCAFQPAEGVSYVEREPYALAKQKLACQNLLLGRVGKFVREPVQLCSQSAKLTSSN